MSKFKIASKKKSVVSTASLPDIVFLLLFFFMMTATIRAEEDQQKIVEPRARALTKVEQKRLIQELVVGPMKDDGFGADPKILADGRLIPVDQIPQWALEAQSRLPEYLRPQMVVLIRADENVRMGLISDIQEGLREANARKILYRSKEKVE